MNEQIPNIVERIIKRSKFNDINDYKNFLSRLITKISFIIHGKMTNIIAKKLH